MSMISRQKLIDKLKHWHLTNTEHGVTWLPEHFVAEAIEALYQPPADQWIPCSSGKMPKDGQTVPITILLSEGKRLLVHATYHAEKPSYWHPYDWNGKGFYIHDSEFGECKYETVIAWLDVEPYKGVE